MRELLLVSTLRYSYKVKTSFQSTRKHWFWRINKRKDDLKESTQPDFFRKHPYRISWNFPVRKAFIWPIGDIRSFSKFRSRCHRNWRYVKYMMSSPCCYGNTDVNGTNLFGKSVQFAVAEPSRVARFRAPLLSKSGNLSSQEILLVT